MAEWRCKLKDVDEYISSEEMQEEFLWDETLPAPFDDEERAKEEGHTIVLWGPDIVLEAYGLILSNGTSYLWDENDVPMPDFSLTMITDGGWSEYLYWEQDPPEVALYNFLRMTGKEYDADTECVLRHKEGYDGR